jgi:hypothetical protein
MKDYKPLRQHHCQRLGIFALVCVLLSGCASQPPAPDLATLAPKARQVQQLIIETPQQSHTLLGVIEHDHRSLRMALMSVQGQRLLTLVQDAEGARFLPGAGFEPPFTADWLAARLAWSLWSAVQLQDTFRRTTWSVRQDVSGHSVYRRDMLVAHVGLSDNCTLIDDVQTGYRLYIIPIALASEPKEHLCPAL